MIPLLSIYLEKKSLSVQKDAYNIKRKWKQSTKKKMETFHLPNLRGVVILFQNPYIKEGSNLFSHVLKNDYRWEIIWSFK